MEKFGTSEFDNSTGAYELDLSLTDDFDKAWRTMHVKSDVFCSGAVVLPDKGARQLNVGGWSLDSTQGVRLYTPDEYNLPPASMSNCVHAFNPQTSNKNFGLLFALVSGALPVSLTV